MTSPYGTAVIPAYTRCISGSPITLPGSITSVPLPIIPGTLFRLL